jgi:hypothetical protein
MPKMTGARLFAETMRGYEVLHIFFADAYHIAERETARHHDINAVIVVNNNSGLNPVDGVTDTYAVAPHPWTATARDFHLYQKTGA